MAGILSTPAAPVGVLSNPALTQYQKPDQKRLEEYATTFPFLAHALGNPQELMKIIDVIYKREAGRSPGTQGNYFVSRMAKSALSDLYGVNDYTPKGFMKYEEDEKKWVDPRTGGGTESSQ